MRAAELVALPEDDLEEFVGWIDWRSADEEVVSVVRIQTGELLECYWEDDEFLLKWQDSRFRIPLTMSRVDRYVTINSLAEILREEYRFFLRDGYEGSDTHGLLVVDRECAADLVQNHQTWLQKNFDKLPPGIDFFTGLHIPYYGNENNNPKFKEELDKADAELLAYREEIRNNPEMQKIGRDLRVKLGRATVKERFFYYLRRYWWVIFFFLWVWLRQ